MGRFMTHEALALGLFNRDYSSGTGPYAHWVDSCRNSPEILQLLVRRMHDDYAQLHTKMRKAYTMKDLEFGLLLVDNNCLTNCGSMVVPIFLRIFIAVPV